MKLSTPVLKRIALIGGGVLVAILLLLWLALPRILQAQAEAFVSEKTGHRLTMARPEFNPFALRLRLSQLQLAEPNGDPLLGFDELIVDVSAASLPLRALVFDAITLTGAEATVTQQADGGLNWGPFLAALKGAETPPEQKTALPRLDIRQFALANGRIAFADRRSGFATRVEPLDISLTDVSTLPDDSGKFSITAKTALGADLALAGAVDLNPLALSGSLDLKGLIIERLAPYLKDALPAAPRGTADLAARYRVGNEGGKMAVVVEDIRAQVTGLRVPLDAADRVGIALGEVSLVGGRLDLAERHVAVAHLRLAQGTLQIVRNSAGRIDLLEAVQVLAGRGKPADKAQAASPWRFELARFELADTSVRFRDEGVTPAADMALEKIAIGVTDVSQDMTKPLPLTLSFDVQGGGHFEASGKATPGAPAADLKLALTDLSLKPAEAYLASKAAVSLVGGKLSSAGRFTFDGKQGPQYRGDFALRELRINEAGTRNVLLGWKRLNTDEFTVTPQRLDIGELRLGGLDTKLIIDKDKQINFKKVLKPAPEKPAAEATAPAAKDGGFLVNIGRLRFYNGEMWFADESLVLPFGTRIHGLRGSLAHLSSRPGGAHGQVELEGEVDEYGMARAAGQVDLFDPTGFMDLRVLFKNVEMTRLTPYTATFAGRRIDAGKLSLDLQYKIKQRQLQGENQVIVDRLKLGERIDSPTAKDLPLDLAIAILEDSDGRIDLGLPVSGNLDDPQFSYGAIVWKAITNVLTKIVTAPFRALASLFGGGDEKAATIVFEPGARQLTPPEREKLVKLAEAMGKRPNLLLSVAGTWAEADRVALQDLQLRRTVLKEIGERVSEERDPGPLSTAQPKVRTALEDLYAKRYGGSDLAALKEGFRKANPGQLEESMTGKMMSRLSGLLREKKTLSAAEVDQLKGADFHALLYERVRAREAVGDDKLQALAQARADFAMTTLKSAGVALERFKTLAVEKAEAANGEVPLKLAFDAIKKD